MKHQVYFIIVTLLLCISCSKSNTKEQESSVDNSKTTLINQVLQAHGGLEKWRTLQTFEYIFSDKQEHHQINLWNRKSLITTPKYKIGSNGKNVWMLQDSTHFSKDPRFYHNLYFYFIAMPFVLADPGIIYESVADLEVGDQKYAGVKISYESNVGDAAKDNYILYYDKTTYEMAYLAYTVTYFSDEASTKYKLIKYTFDEIDGIKLPTQMQWFSYKEGIVGEASGEPKIISNIKLSTTPLDSSLFSIPEGATLH